MIDTLFYAQYVALGLGTGLILAGNWWALLLFGIGLFYAWRRKKTK